MPQEYPRADDGLLMASGDCGTFEFGGFHKVDIDPVTLMYGQNFSIVITEKTSDGKYSINVPTQTANDYISVINPTESIYQIDGGDWLDLSEEDDQADLMKLDEGTPPMLCDNFVIKGYAEPMEGIWFNAGLSGSTSLYFTPENGQATVQIVTSRYFNTLLPRIEKVKWELDDTIYDLIGEPVDQGKLVDFEGLDEENCGNKAIIKVRKEGDKYMVGNQYLFVYLYGVEDMELGTIVVKVHTDRSSIDGVRLKDEDTVITYTESAIEPEIKVIDFQGNGMREDIDYTLEFKDNIKCGVATVEATAIGDYEKDTPGYAFFPIQLAKAVLKNVTAGVCMVTVTVEDQAESAITGYQVQYREKGTEKWLEKKFDASSSQLKGTGLTEGKHYEVQVCGYVEIEDAGQYWGKIEDVYYGEYSDCMTSDAVGPAIAVEKIAFVKTKKELATKTTAQLKVKFTPSDATDQRLTWTSSNPEIASVDKNGVVTAKTRGTATITAKSKANTALKATCKVTVKFNDAYYDLDGTGESNVTKEMETAINWAADQKITGETVSFGTKNSMTHGQFVRFLHRYAGSPKVSNPNNPFSDVTKSAAIAWGKSKKIFTGKKFEPNANCLRIDFALFLYRYDKAK